MGVPTGHNFEHEQTNPPSASKIRTSASMNNVGLAAAAIAGQPLVVGPGNCLGFGTAGGHQTLTVQLLLFGVGCARVPTDAKQWEDREHNIGS